MGEWGGCRKATGISFCLKFRQIYGGFSPCRHKQLDEVERGPKLVLFPGQTHAVRAAVAGAELHLSRPCFPSPAAGWRCRMELQLHLQGLPRSRPAQITRLARRGQGRERGRSGECSDASCAPRGSSALIARLPRLAPGKPRFGSSTCPGGKPRQPWKTQEFLDLLARLRKMFISPPAVLPASVAVMVTVESCGLSWWSHNCPVDITRPLPFVHSRFG